MHRPEKPTPRLTGFTVAETRHGGWVSSVVRTEHYTVDGGPAAEQVDALVAWLDRIAVRIGGLSDNVELK